MPYKNKEDQRIYHREWCERNKERIYANFRRHYEANLQKILERESHRSRFKLYGITQSEYELMLAQQGGVCALCGSPPKRYRLAVDHDHETGKIRGLLCTPCNRWLGWYENVSRQRIEEYLGSDSGT